MALLKNSHRPRGYSGKAEQPFVGEGGFRQEDSGPQLGKGQSVLKREGGSWTLESTFGGAWQGKKKGTGAEESQPVPPSEKKKGGQRLGTPGQFPPQRPKKGISSRPPAKKKKNQEKTEIGDNQEERVHCKLQKTTT